MKKVTVFWVALILVLGIAGCGGGGSSSLMSPPLPTPTPQPTQTPSISVDKTSLTYATTAGAANPSSQTFTVTSTTGNSINWSAAAATNSGGKWLSISSSSGTTPATITVSSNIAGLGATAFNGTITVTPTGTSGGSANVNVSLQLASPTPPYSTGSNSFSLPPSGPSTITLPDGTVISAGTNQLIVFLAPDATLAQQQAIASVIGAAGASVVGEIPQVHALQVQISDVTKIGGLMLQLQASTGITYAGPNVLVPVSHCPSAACTAQTSDSWRVLDNLPPAPTSANGIVIYAIDCFDATIPSCNLGGGISHGDVVRSFLQNAAGSAIKIIPIDVSTSLDQNGTIDNYDLMEKGIANIVQQISQNPGQKAVINISWGYNCPNKEPFPSDSALSKQESAFYTQLNQLAQNLHETFGDDFLIVKAAGNAGVPVESSSALVGCNFVPVGSLDQVSSTTATMAAESSFGAAIPVYAPGCNVNPNTTQFPGGLVDGTSFAAPQVAGALAAEWATHSRLSACSLSSQLSDVPPTGPGMIPVYNGLELDKLLNGPPRASSQPPPNPINMLPCNQITASATALSLSVDQTQQVTATTSVTGITPTFQFLSSNPTVATVDPASGVVKAVKTGTALIYVSAPPSISCSAAVPVVVASETYAGTITLHATDTHPNTPGWIPDPITTDVTANSVPLQFSVAPSLLQSGTFTAVITLGPGNATVTIPAQTCTVCNPPVTAPGSTTTTPFSAASFSLTGTSDGKVLSIPVGDGLIMTGTISVIGPTVQVTLNLNAQEPDGIGGTLTEQLSAALTRQ